MPTILVLIALFGIGCQEQAPVSISKVDTNFEEICCERNSDCGPYGYCSDYQKQCIRSLALTRFDIDYSQNYEDNDSARPQEAIYVNDGAVPTDDKEIECPYELDHEHQETL